MCIFSTFEKTSEKPTFYIFVLKYTFSYATQYFWRYTILFVEPLYNIDTNMNRTPKKYIKRDINCFRNVPPPPLFVDALGLTDKERAVFDALIFYKAAARVVRISERAKISRTSTHDILLKFEKRKIAISIRFGEEKVARWMYNRKINRILKSPDNL